MNFILVNLPRPIFLRVFFFRQTPETRVFMRDTLKIEYNRLVIVSFDPSHGAGKFLCFLLAFGARVPIFFDVRKIFLRASFKVDFFFQRVPMKL